MNKNNSADKKGGPQDVSNNNTPASNPIEMYSNQPSSPKGKDEKESPYYKSQAPEISLPKGGGALKGIDEKFSVNAVNGTSSLQVPFPFTPGRNGFTPSLTLDYNSGSGNSEFGLGWSMSLPAIQRKTDRQLPQYNDAIESDVFLLAGAEDLVPELDMSGNPVIDTSIAPYVAKRYKPRIEGLFARIEFIRESGTNNSWWRVTTKDNIVTYYGLTAAARITDPANAQRIYKWLPQLVYDFKGNVQEFTYVAEDLVNVPVTIHERNRLNGLSPIVNKYLKKVSYCNINAYTAIGPVYQPALPSTPDYMMELMLDYGDYNITTGATQPWPCRSDAFSDFHAGFEIRTYRTCRRVIMFHKFKELSGGTTYDPVCIRSLDLTYQNQSATQLTEADYITEIIQTGYKKRGSGFVSKSLPAMTFAYNPLAWNTQLQNVSKQNVRNAPQGLTGPYQWIDLYGEGLPGILAEQGDGWFYKTNKGNGNFTAGVRVARKPALTGLGSNLQWQDLDADGRRQVVSRDENLPGYFELDDDQQWQPFRNFKKNIAVDWDSPYTKMIDLDGDGRADLLITEDRVWIWHKNEGKKGFERGGQTHVWNNEEQGPRLLVNDNIQRIFLADMNGDGLTDLVRITNGEVCYWPNVGYGKFGRRVTMSNSPRFDNPEKFNPQYITLADISGTGAADLIYLGKNKCTAWINYAGNGYGIGVDINPLPASDQYSKIAVMDFLGNGTACIVWSSPLPLYANAPMRYIDLMGGKKPYLMASYQNGMGKAVSVTYKSSTAYYLADKAAGTPWATRLPFPVQCVSEILTTEYFSETSYKQTFTYHHGYYDHEEREFRGFGRVETLDAEKTVIDTTPLTSLDQWPVLTKTWYNTGAWLREHKLLDAFEEEYYKHASWWAAPENQSLPSSLTAVEVREAYRANKSLPLRQEVYAKDGTPLQSIPFTVTAFGYDTQMLQARFKNRHGVFHTHQQQKITWHCERVPEDPRVLHELALQIDKYGNVLQAANISYPRQDTSGLPMAVADAVAPVQEKMLVSYTLSVFTDAALGSKTMYRTPVPCKVQTFEVYNLPVPTTAFIQPGSLYTPGAISTNIQNFAQIDFSAAHTPGINQIRLLSDNRISYYNNVMDGPVTPITTAPGAVLLEYRKYTLAFTDAIIAGTPVTAGLLDNARYLTEVEIDEFDSTDTTRYWMASGRIEYSSGFYMPEIFFDPWDNETEVNYWPNYNLLPATVTDALGSTTTVNAYDWRCLQPTGITDVNDNVSEILYDALCMPVAMALKGKAISVPLGDALGSIDPDAPADLDNQEAMFTTGPGTIADDLLGTATWRCVYRFTPFAPDPTPGVPKIVAVAMIVREQHNTAAGASPMQIRYTYTDGLGRVAMHKAQTTDNPVGGALRWVGSGKTVYNNKGNVVMQYEPYYSDTFAYDTNEQAESATVTPRMHYDPLDRLARTDMPDGTYTKTVWSAWMQQDFDGNDNVTGSAWLARMESVPANVYDVDAATKAKRFANTPITVYFDTLARPFFTAQCNRLPAAWTTDVYYYTLNTLDIQGNRLKVTDARNIEILTFTYNMVQVVLHQLSNDSGSQYLLADVAGQPANNWDADDRMFGYTYDVLRRPLTKTVTEAAVTKTMLVTQYGEGATDDKKYNLRGKPVLQKDGAGTVATTSYDFKGNPLSTTRTFAAGNEAAPDWSGTVPMEGATYTTATTYDALNRPMVITTPDGGNTNYTYDKGAQLYSLKVSGVRGFTNDIIEAIEYNARGQRTKVKYTKTGAPAAIFTTTYQYDVYNYRVTNIVTTRTSGSAELQNLQYWYDAVGNITYQKNAHLDVIFYNGTAALPDHDYTYDALYKLVQTTGREHISSSAPDPTGSSDSSRVDITRIAPTPIPPMADSQKMETYIEKYSYDAVGNITELKHIAQNSARSWTRSFFAGDYNNRLMQSETDTGSIEFYDHDNRGNMLAGFEHILYMTYNAANVLDYVELQDHRKFYYQYDANGQRVRKVLKSATGVLTTSRLYVGGWELYREYTGGIATLTRETLHVMDDSSRVAIIDTLIAGTNTHTQRFQLSDHLSSATLELDIDGAILTYEEYYAFGSTSFSTGTTMAEVSMKRYRYIGKERDEGTGFYYIGARYYVSWLCRWTAVDPLEAELTPESPYCYAHNNPISWSDPDGMEPKVKHEVNVHKTDSNAKKAQTSKQPELPQQHAARDNTGHAPTIAPPNQISADPRSNANLPKETSIDQDFSKTIFGSKGGLEYSKAILQQEMDLFVPGGTLLMKGIKEEPITKLDIGLELLTVLPISKLGKAGSVLFKLSDKAFYSATGLVFKQGGKEGNRLSHVLEHTKNSFAKDYHGIFDAKSLEGIVNKLDDAWAKVKSGSKDVIAEPQKNGNFSYIIDMHKQVGTEGGKLGKGDPLTRIKIVIEGGTKSNVITAYPVR